MWCIKINPLRKKVLLNSFCWKFASLFTSSSFTCANFIVSHWTQAFCSNSLCLLQIYWLKNITNNCINVVNSDTLIYIYIVKYRNQSMQIMILSMTICCMCRSLIPFLFTHNINVHCQLSCFKCFRIARSVEC